VWTYYGPERLAGFRHEARAVAALNHPHIVTIFSIEEEEGVPFLTMELVEGRSLDRAVSGGGLSLERFSTSASRSPTRSRRRTARASCIAT